MIADVEQVYLNDSDKPEIGVGLNKPAEITILDCFKIDKATGRPTTDPKVLAAFVKRLKAAAAQQKARFVDYNPEQGIWKFQVDHFTKYALYFHKTLYSTHCRISRDHLGRNWIFLVTCIGTFCQRR